ncbi:ATP-binding protein [Streptomyces sp. NPDC008125]|uniref:ATP-binding protein n=1 Tax=Streptomyces sp. NPDC008125 TaxID=3364811 RepID=UPI0036E3F453
MTPPLVPATGHAPLAAPALVQRFSSTPRGARLARRLVVHQLDVWGVPYGSDASDTAAQLVAELTANAVTHGHVPGRDFEIAVDITTESGGRTLRIAVSDARGELRPPAPDMPPPFIPRPAESGRGLLLVKALADRWDVVDRPSVGKTVVAELDLPPGTGQGGLRERTAAEGRSTWDRTGPPAP